MQLMFNQFLEIPLCFEVWVLLSFALKALQKAPKGSIGFPYLHLFTLQKSPNKSGGNPNTKYFFLNSYFSVFGCYEAFHFKANTLFIIL